MAFVRASWMGIALWVGACEPVGELPLGDDPVPAVLWESPEWGPLTWWEDTPGYALSAAYARAVGTSMNTGCSGFLIEDDVFVTAHHCLPTAGPGSTMVVTFGLYGNGDYALGEADARRRVQRLGLPASGFLFPGTSTTFLQALRTFTCDFGSNEFGLDTQYWRCRPNVFVWTETRTLDPFGPHFRFADLLPGQIWGHYNVALGARPEGRPIVANSVNRVCLSSLTEVLIGPGTVDESDVWCPDIEGFDYRNSCFDFTGDTTGGSSGGPVVERDTGLAIGVISGGMNWALGDVNDPCDRWSAAINTAAYLGPELWTYIGDAPVSPPIGGGATVTSQVGNRGGVEHNFQCPPGSLVAGLVGTTFHAPGNEVGDLGFVCVPRTGSTRLRFDRATVNTGGSQDVGFRVAVNEDLNTFLHETRSSSFASPGEPMLMMCPPGQFLVSVEAHAGTFTSRINTLVCQSLDGVQSTRVPVFGNTGHLGYWTTGWEQSATCPAGRFVAGGWIDAGWLTDGFQLRCHAPF